MIKTIIPNEPWLRLPATCRAPNDGAGGRLSHPDTAHHGLRPAAVQESGSLTRTSADCPVATRSIQVVPRSSGGTILSHSTTSPLFPDGIVKSVPVACQRPLLSRTHSAGSGRTTLLYVQSSSAVTPLTSVCTMVR